MTNPTPRALVPVTPTLEMQHAYFKVIDANMKAVETCAAFGRYDNNGIAWRAAIKAAPHSGAVSKEDVERAAEAMYENGKLPAQGPWAKLPDCLRDVHREDARIAFRAIGLTVEG
jgi:hypothetical protein